MIIYTVHSLNAEQDGTYCAAVESVPCNDPSCSAREHALYCTRPKNHPADVHVGTAFGEIVAVWRAS